MPCASVAEDCSTPASSPGDRLPHTIQARRVHRSDRAIQRRVQRHRPEQSRPARPSRSLHASPATSEDQHRRNDTLPDHGTATGAELPAPTATRRNLRRSASNRSVQPDARETPPAAASTTTTEPCAVSVHLRALSGDLLLSTSEVGLAEEGSCAATRDPQPLDGCADDRGEGGDGANCLTA